MPRSIRKRRMLSPVATRSITGNAFTDIENASFMRVILYNNRGSAKNQEEICTEDDFEEIYVLKNQKTIVAV